MIRLGLLIAAVVLALDQVSKEVILGAAAGLPVTVTPFFNLVLVWNRGISFGMLDAAGGATPWVLAGLSLAVVVALTIWLTRAKDRIIVIGLGLVIGGALGNVIDRIRFGAVVDFLDFHAAGYHWPAFNAADSAIVVGAGLLILDGLLGKRHHPT